MQILANAFGGQSSVSSSATMSSAGGKQKTQPAWADMTMQQMWDAALSIQKKNKKDEWLCRDCHSDSLSRMRMRSRLSFVGCGTTTAKAIASECFRHSDISVLYLYSASPNPSQSRCWRSGCPTRGVRVDPSCAPSVERRRSEAGALAQHSRDGWFGHSCSRCHCADFPPHTTFERSAPTRPGPRSGYCCSSTCNTTAREATGTDGLSSTPVDRCTRFRSQNGRRGADGQEQSTDADASGNGSPYLACGDCRADSQPPSPGAGSCGNPPQRPPAQHSYDPHHGICMATDDGGDSASPSDRSSGHDCCAIITSSVPGPAGPTASATSTAAAAAAATAAATAAPAAATSAATSARTPGIGCPDSGGRVTDVAVSVASIAHRCDHPAISGRVGITVAAHEYGWAVACPFFVAPSFACVFRVLLTITHTMFQVYVRAEIPNSGYPAVMPAYLVGGCQCLARSVASANETQQERSPSPLCVQQQQPSSTPCAMKLCSFSCLPLLTARDSCPLFLYLMWPFLPGTSLHAPLRGMLLSQSHLCLLSDGRRSDVLLCPGSASMSMPSDWCLASMTDAYYFCDCNFWALGMPPQRSATRPLFDDLGALIGLLWRDCANPPRICKRRADWWLLAARYDTPFSLQEKRGRADPLLLSPHRHCALSVYALAQIRMRMLNCVSFGYRYMCRTEHQPPKEQVRAQLRENHNRASTGPALLYSAIDITDPHHDVRLREHCGRHPEIMLAAGRYLRDHGFW